MKKKLIPAYLLTFLNFLTLSILIPVLPFIVDSHQAPRWVYGMLITLYASFQFLGAPYLGKLSDRYGRKPILLLSQAGTLLSWGIFLGASFLPPYAVLGWSIPLCLIGLSRVLDGITGGNTSVTQALVSDITTPREKKSVFGILGGISGLGMIIGPALGGISASFAWGYVGTLVLVVIIAAITLLAVFLWVGETKPARLSPQNTTSATPQGKATLLGSVFFLNTKLWKRLPLLIRWVFVIRLLFCITMATYISTITLFMIDTFDFDEEALGYYMFFVGLFLSFNQAVVSGFFIRKIKEFPTLLLGLLLCVLGLVAITLSQNLIVYMLCYYVLNLGLSLCFPSFQIIISTHAPKDIQGEVLGVNESIQSFCMAAFPIITTAIYGWVGADLYRWASVLPLTALLLAYFWVKRVWSKECLTPIEHSSPLQ